jgi:hypothetical protein
MIQIYVLYLQQKTKYDIHTIQRTVVHLNILTDVTRKEVYNFAACLAYYLTLKM